MKKSHKVGGGQRWFLEEVGPSEKVSLQLGHEIWGQGAPGTGWKAARSSWPW